MIDLASISSLVHLMLSLAGLLFMPKQSLFVLYFGYALVIHLTELDVLRSIEGPGIAFILLNLVFFVSALSRASQE